LLFPLFCLGQTAPTLPDPCAANSAAIEAVRAGSRNEASAAWWGFNAEDATECLQSAIDSGAKKVVVPFMGTEWIVRPIRLRGNLELVFEPGVVVLAKKGEFRGKGDSLFAAADAENITLRGYGATLRMRKKDYQHSPYAKAEWRMTLDFTGCRKIAVEGLRLESSGGDGIYIGATHKQPFCEGVVIRDVTCHDHHRQGISVISAVNLLIENCILSGTGGTAPQAGIDFEPNSPGERLKNCVVRNCTMADNTGAGLLVYLNPLSRATEPVSLLFENCLVQGGKDTGIGVGAIKDDGPQGCVEFRNCTVIGVRKSCSQRTVSPSISPRSPRTSRRFPRM
jgi:polygalacturonase